MLHAIMFNVMAPLIIVEFLGVEQIQDKYEEILESGPWINSLFQGHDWNGE